MKKIILLFTAALLAADAFAQAPNLLSYQTVIRNSSGALVTNTSVGMKISILQGSATGNAVYIETQIPTTNANGLASLQIGNGTVVNGSISAINWSSGDYWIETQTDLMGGTNYTITGTAQLLSVPYALYAQTAGNGGGGATGATGAPGTTGPSGSSGATGPTGPTGMTGVTGASGSANAWGLTGNTGTTIAANFVGTIDSAGLVFKVHNQRAGFLDASNALNTSFGSHTMGSLTSGNNNTAIGASALVSDTSGTFNTAVGVGTLFFNTSGSSNTILGTYAGYGNTTGGNNTATGFQALTSNTAGSINVADGYQALFSNIGGTNGSLGSQNVAIGGAALYSNKQGYGNTATGHATLYSNTTGIYNTACGYVALYSNTSGSNSTAVGAYALNACNTGTFNTAIGTGALQSDTSGSYNFAGGYRALYSNTSGTNNSAIGYQSLYSNTSGANNIGIGSWALFSNITGTANVAIGYGAETNLTSGYFNIGIGEWALSNDSSGVYNTAIGHGALQASVNGSGNTAIGYLTIDSNSTGGFNTAIGDQALSANHTGSYNTALGTLADVTVNGLTNATAVGYNAKVGASNSLVLGGTGNYAVNVGIGTIAPNYPLDIQGSSNTQIRLTYPSGRPYFASMAFSDPNQGASDIVARMDLGFESLAGNSNSYIAFRTGQSPFAGNVDISKERMRIASSGYVGIGTESPVATFQVVTDSSNGNVGSWGAGQFVVGLAGQAGGLGFSYDSINSAGYISSLTPTVAWRDLGLRAYNTIFYYGGNELMRVTPGGKVGIGTNAPNAPLHVHSSNAGGNIGTGYYFYGNNGNIVDGAQGSANLCIQADGWFWANSGGFLATSDERIKNRIGITDNQKDLETISKIQITDYKYKDEINNGSGLQKKVIAQQVKEIYPIAVQENEGIIPNVYAQAESVTISGDLTIIKTCEPHDFKTGDVVKLIVENEGEKELPVVVQNTNTFTVAEKITNKVFVYGKKVKDLLNVDYDALSMLNVSATQALIKKVAALEEENHCLTEDNATLQNAKADAGELIQLKLQVEKLRSCFKLHSFKI